MKTDYTFKSDEIYLYLIKNLSRKRLLHSIGTAVCARSLAERHGIDRDKSFLAALAHDLARELPGEELKRLVADEAMELEEDFFARPVLLHGPAAASILKRNFYIYDQSVLNAVKWHTLGNPAMDEIAKIVYISDYIEITRKHILKEEREEIFAGELNSSLYRILSKEKKYYKGSSISFTGGKAELYSNLEEMLKYEKS